MGMVAKHIVLARIQLSRLDQLHRKIVSQPLPKDQTTEPDGLSAADLRRWVAPDEDDVSEGQGQCVRREQQ